MTTIKLPFERQTWYPLKEIEIFEDALLLARRQDKQLDADLRLAQQPWMKLRNSELYPLHYFAEQTQATEAVDGVGDEAAWSAPQSTLFVKDGDATWIVSVFQVADDKTAQIRTVAEAVGLLFVAA